VWVLGCVVYVLCLRDVKGVVYVLLGVAREEVCRSWLRVSTCCVSMGGGVG